MSRIYKFITYSVILILLLSSCGKKEDPKEYKDGELNVTPDPTKFTHATAGEGWDIYLPVGSGYRYGPTIFVNADKSIDAWFASPGGGGQWDWIFFKSSKDGGKTWTKEKVVLQGTPDSMDLYSTCDPGVVKIGDYYYLGYTSTIDLGGICNNVFVARSKNPDGPYEKWNGKGWGGDPMPIVYFDDNAKAWGVGEPSFVLLDDTLYIYYSWSSLTSGGKGILETRVAKADAKDPNWPSTMEYLGVAVSKSSGSAEDSCDVKYIDDYGKFVAISTRKRLSDESIIVLYMSDDGVNFTEVGSLRNNICQFCHNAGISGRPNGHIRVKDDTYVSYAYGPQWALWATRMHKITYTLDDIIDDPEKKAKTILVDPPTPEAPEFTAAAIFCSNPYYVIPVDYKKERIYAAEYDGYFRANSIDINKVKFGDYDKKVIYIKDGYIYPKAVGYTSVTVMYKDFQTTFKVRITKEYTENQDLTNVVGMDILQDTYTVNLSDRYAKQIRTILRYENSRWTEIFLQKYDGLEKKYNITDGVTFSDYDESILEIDSSGIIKAKSVGTTTVKVTYGNYSQDIKVIIR